MGQKGPSLNVMPRNSASGGIRAGVALVSGPRTVRAVAPLCRVTTISHRHTGDRGKRASVLAACPPDPFDKRRVRWPILKNKRHACNLTVLSERRGRRPTPDHTNVGDPTVLLNRLAGQRREAPWAAPPGGEWTSRWTACTNRSVLARLAFPETLARRGPGAAA